MSVSVCVSVCERERQTDRQTETETERQRHTKTETERQRHRERERERDLIPRTPVWHYPGTALIELGLDNSAWDGLGKAKRQQQSVFVLAAP